MNMFLRLVFILSVSPAIVHANMTNKAAPPEQRFLLTIDDAVYEITMDRKQRFFIGDTSRTVQLEPYPTRTFKKAGIHFEFEHDRHYSYESLEPSIDFWLMEGKSSAIEVRLYDKVIEQKDVMKAIDLQYAAMNAHVSRSRTELQTGETTHKGVRLIIRMSGIQLEQEIFIFQSSDRTTVLILQDTLNNEGKNSDEYVDMRKLIRDSLKVSF